jgi:rhodanese-related sulfurtransferase
MDGRFVFPSERTAASRAVDERQNGPMNSITVQQLRERRDVPLIDVREAGEFAAGRVPGAVNLPMSRIGELLDELPDGEFDVICAVGGRSARLVQALEARGYAANNVEGGTNGWAEAGYPVER